MKKVIIKVSAGKNVYIESFVKQQKCLSEVRFFICGYATILLASLDCRGSSGPSRSEKG